MLSIIIFNFKSVPNFLSILTISDPTPLLTLYQELGSLSREEYTIGQLLKATSSVFFPHTMASERICRELVGWYLSNFNWLIAGWKIFTI